jgi:hypothetical protein
VIEAVRPTGTRILGEASHINCVVAGAPEIIVGRYSLTSFPVAGTALTARCMRDARQGHKVCIGTLSTTDGN